MKTTKIIALALTIITASSCKDNKTEVTSKKDLEEKITIKKDKKMNILIVLTSHDK